MDLPEGERPAPLLQPGFAQLQEGLDELGMCQRLYRNAVELLDRYEHKAWQQVIPDGTFPELLHIGANIDYVREILLSVQLTGLREDYVPVSSLPDNAEFFLYQQQVNPDARIVPSHQVIEQYLAGHGMDYRFEVGAHPVDALRDHRCDNVSIGRDRPLQKYTAPIG